MAKFASIQVVSVGQSFGVRAKVVARNGRVLAETRLYPHGMDGQAAAAAERLAADQGYTVVGQ